MLFDADQQNYPYVKRFTLERCQQARPQSFVGDNPNTRFVLLTDQIYPRLLITYGGNDDFRDPMELDVEGFIGVKSYKAKGKRITTCTVQSIKEIEPTHFPEADTAEEEFDENALDESAGNTPTEQTEPSLFDDNNATDEA